MHFVSEWPWPLTVWPNIRWVARKGKHSFYGHVSRKEGSCMEKEIVHQAKDAEEDQRSIGKTTSLSGLGWKDIVYWGLVKRENNDERLLMKRSINPRIDYDGTTATTARTPGGLQYPCGKFGDCSFSRFVSSIMRTRMHTDRQTDRQTDTQTYAGERFTPRLSSVWVKLANRSWQNATMNMSIRIRIGT